MEGLAVGAEAVDVGGVAGLILKRGKANVQCCGGDPHGRSPGAHGGRSKEHHGRRRAQIASQAGLGVRQRREIRRAKAAFGRRVAKTRVEPGLGYVHFGRVGSQRSRQILLSNRFFEQRFQCVLGWDRRTCCRECGSGDQQRSREHQREDQSESRHHGYEILISYERGERNHKWSPSKLRVGPVGNEHSGAPVHF